jgi:predicted aspartyl protease
VKDTAIEEGSIDGNHLIMICTLSLNTKEIPTHTLIDYGATGYAFIDQDFADHHKLPLYPLKIPHTLEFIDG